MDVLDGAQRLRALMAEREDAEQRLKALDKEITKLRKDITDEMANRGAISIDLDWAKFTIQVRTNYTVASGKMAETTQALCENGYGDVVKQYITYFDLQHVMRMLRESGAEDVPEWLDGLVRKNEKPTLVIRQRENSSES